MLPEEFREDYREIIEVDPESYEHMLIKAADKIAAYIKCVEETRRGNKEFAKAKITLKKEVDAYRKHEEIDWFCETYLDTFSLTLDELE
jgi:5'-deoxynucleotidase